MKFVMMMALIISTPIFANEKDSTRNESKTVQEIVKEGKSSRKKKVEICHDCGKPESKCDCEGDEHRKGE